MSGNDWLSYHFAILRVVPHVNRGEFVNIGVVLHVRTAEFLKLRALSDLSSLGTTLRGVDIDMLTRYVDLFRGICDGRAEAGPIALLPSSERFHWIISPRSDLLQCSPVHEGICVDPDRTLGELFSEMVSQRG